MYMYSAPFFNVDPTAMVKMQSSATIYGVGMIQASLFNIYIIQIHFLMASNEKGLTIVSKHWIIDDITISKAFE